MTTTFRPASALTVGLQSTMNPGQYLPPAVIQNSQVAIPENLDMNQVQRVRNELRRMSAAQLGTYQPPSAAQTAKISDTLLDLAKASDIDVLETKFADIINMAKTVDVTTLTNPKKKWFQSLRNVVATAKEDLIKSHSSASDYIERTFSSIQKNADAIASRVTTLEQMHVATQQTYIEYDYFVTAGKLEIEQRKAELELIRQQAVNDPANITLQSQLQEGQFYLQQLEIKVGNDIADQQMHFTLLPQIRMMESNALTLGQTFTTLRGTVLNNWKMQFALTLIGNEQQRGANVQNAVLDMNNQLARNNATAVRQTTIAVTTANQRGVYDLSTLEHVHNETIGAFEDYFRIAQEGRTNRDKVETAVATMKQQMAQKLAAF